MQYNSCIVSYRPARWEVRQLRAFGHALGGDGLDVGAVDGPCSSWRRSPHLLKRERHEIACSTRVHSPSHVSIRSTRLGVGAGVEHWVSTFENAHKDFYLLQPASYLGLPRATCRVTEVTCWLEVTSA